MKKSFRAVAAASKRIDPSKWQLITPEKPDAPLEVRFPEPLDHALLGRLLTVSNSAGKLIEGRVEVSEGETRWCLQPVKPWVAGDYELHIGKELEDRAGNRLDRLFDEDLNEQKKTAPPILKHVFSAKFEPR